MEGKGKLCQILFLSALVLMCLVNTRKHFSIVGLTTCSAVAYEKFYSGSASGSLQTSCVKFQSPDAALFHSINLIKDSPLSISCFSFFSSFCSSAVPISDSVFP